MKKEKKAKEIELLDSCLALSVRMVVTLKHFTFPPLVIWLCGDFLKQESGNKGFNWALRKFCQETELSVQPGQKKKNTKEHQTKNPDEITIK